jgi:hypothetical protein
MKLKASHAKRHEARAVSVSSEDKSKTQGSEIDIGSDKRAKKKSNSSFPILICCKTERDVFFRPSLIALMSTPG